MTDPVLALTAVSKLYAAAPPVAALSDVTLAIRPGEQVAIIGPSGSGKTTLLHLLGALDRPSSGTITIGGRDIGGLSDREVSGIRGHHIGFVFQDFALLGHETALANVSTGLLYHGVKRPQRIARAREALGVVGLAHRLGHRPSQLSGGEQQRVAIARAIAGQPRLLLADEPTGNLDSRTSSQIIALLASLTAAGVAVVVITHDDTVAAAMDRRITLADGRIIHDTAVRS